MGLGFCALTHKNQFAFLTKQRLPLASNLVDKNSSRERTFPSLAPNKYHPTKRLGDICFYANYASNPWYLPWQIPVCVRKREVYEKRSRKRESVFPSLAPTKKAESIDSAFFVDIRGEEFNPSLERLAFEDRVRKFGERTFYACIRTPRRI